MSDLETEKLVGFPDKQEGVSELEWIEKEIEYTTRTLKSWEERGVKIEMDYQYYLNCLGARKKEIVMHGIWKDEGVVPNEQT